MKRFLLIAAFFVFISGCASVTLAQDSTPAATPRFGKVGIDLDRAATKAASRVQQRLTNIKERIASRTAQLKERLRTFRDQKKADIVEKVNGRLANVNEVRTANMLKHLNKMSEILSKLENRVNGVTDKDTTAAKTAINEAKAKVETAKVAVNAQTDKDYPIEATAEATIKNEVVDARLDLHRNLKAVHDLVVEARQAMGSAIQVVAETLGGVKRGQQ